MATFMYLKLQRRYFNPIWKREEKKNKEKRGVNISICHKIAFKFPYQARRALCYVLRS